MDFAPANNSPAAHRLRRLAWRAHLAVVVVLAILLFGMVNYLSMRHYARVHWQRDPQAGLSKQSRRVLAQVVDDIRILAVIRPAHPAYRNLFSLLQEYAAQAPNLSVEWIDPDRDMARTEQVARQYRLGPAEAVVVATGGRSHIVPADDLI
jgi:hypothetical protein